MLLVVLVRSISKLVDKNTDAPPAKPTNSRITVVSNKDTDWRGAIERRLEPRKDRQYNFDRYTSTWASFKELDPNDASSQ